MANVVQRSSPSPEVLEAQTCVELDEGGAISNAYRDAKKTIDTIKGLYDSSGKRVVFIFENVDICRDMRENYPLLRRLLYETAQEAHDAVVKMRAKEGKKDKETVFFFVRDRCKLNRGRDESWTITEPLLLHKDAGSCELVGETRPSDHAIRIFFNDVLLQPEAKRPVVEGLKVANFRMWYPLLGAVPSSLAVGAAVAIPLALLGPVGWAAGIGYVCLATAGGGAMGYLGGMGCEWWSESTARQKANDMFRRRKEFYS